MKPIVAIPLALALAFSTGGQYARSQSDEGEASRGSGMASDMGSEQKLELTAAQRSAIYQAVSKDKSKTAPRRFPAVIGADVPPMIELYALPDDAVADNPAAKLYEYTMMQDQVVLVDPTKMRVIGIIGPPPPPQ